MLRWTLIAEPGAPAMTASARTGTNETAGRRGRADYPLIATLATINDTPGGLGASFTPRSRRGSRSARRGASPAAFGARG
jgi:hypothetical protein